MTSHDLAIVIPAYRGRFLPSALASIANQSDQRFQLYVCDDDSPDDLEAVFRAVFPTASANRRYIRFEENMGAHSMVKQWNRCVAQTQNEPWIWLFSDDDLADSRCVEQFNRARQSGAAVGNVCRFNTAMINEDDVITAINPPHPNFEMAEHFAYHRLRLERRSFAPEYIFRRAAFDANHGFVDFPFGLGSDDASWIVFAGDLPMITLPEARVFWRWSGHNTSAIAGKSRGEKVLALAEFSQWLQQRFGDRSPDLGGTALPSQIRMDGTAREWFFRNLHVLPAGFGYLTAARVALALRRRGFGGTLETITRLWLAIFRGQREFLTRRLKQWVRR